MNKKLQAVKLEVTGIYSAERESKEELQQNKMSLFAEKRCMSFK
ncbi:hypothetical protein ACUXCC_003361 [Cytobacillus horneckiae]|nr:hypothetical protein [Cytobacillus horneckiae]MEC1157500.1 hypothetical protein [Cytobacillus horneckiae]MED2939448.1 hypothetical protein [Cytobacillus horneckiae]